MKTTYTIYNADGTTKAGEVDWPESPGYQAIKALVEPIVGDPMEHVTVLYKGKRADMFVDELGHMREHIADGNPAATEIYRANWLSRYPSVAPHTLPSIVGTAIVFDRIVWN